MNGVNMASWVYLLLAVVSETVATSALKHCDGFSRILPVLIVVVGYVVSFVCLSKTLATIPLGIAYGIWAGLGIVLIALIDYLVMGQKLDLPAIIGICFIGSGVAIINFFSKSVVH